MFDGVIYGPYYAVEALGLLLILTIGIHLLNGSVTGRFRISSTDVQILFLVVYIMGRAMTAGEFMANVPDVVLILCLTIIYFLFKYLIGRDEATTSHIFAAAFIISVIINLGFGCKQILESSVTFPQHAISGLFSNPSLFAIYLSAALPFCIGILTLSPIMGRGATAIKVIAFLASLGVLFVLPYTHSRTGWLAAAFGSCVFIFRSYWNTKRRKRLQYIAVGILAFIFVGFGIFYENILAYKVDSTEGRFFIYKQTAAMISDHPVRGVGFNRFGVEYIRYQEKYFKNTLKPGKEELLADNTRVAMSDFLQVWAELGVFSIILVGCILVALLTRTGKSRLLPGTQGSLMALAIGVCFSYPLHCVPIIIEIVFLSAIVAALSEENSFLVKGKKALIGCSAVSLLCLVLVVSRFGIDEISARIRWKNATYPDDSGADLRQYQSIYPTLCNDPQFLYKYGYELNRAGRYDSSNQVLIRSLRLIGDSDACSLVGDNYVSLGNLDQAEDYYLRAASITPNRFYPKFKLFELNLLRGRVDQARIWAHRVDKMHIKVPSSTVYVIKRRVRSWLQEHKGHLSDKRIRYCFNYFENMHDTLAIKSLEFLLAGMHDKYSIDSLGNIKYDLDHIQPTLLIDNINASLKICRTRINNGTLPFLDFCEFVLPYRFANEPLINWRQECMNKQYLRKSRHSGNISGLFDINRQISKGFIFSYSGGLDRNSTWVEMERAKRGDCWVMNYTSAYPLRAYGYPVAIDFVPIWGNTNGGAHSWSVFLENGLETAFMGSESADIGYQVKRIYCEERIPPKVFRETFSSNEEMRIDEEPGNIPQAIEWENRIDVTEKYTPVKNIIIRSGKLRHHRVAYLATYSNGEWVPVFWANIAGNTCKFRKMATDVLYLPTIVEKGRMKPLSSPFRISSLTGQLTEFEANEKAAGKINIKTTQSRAMDELLAYSLGRLGTDFFDTMDSVDLDKRRSRPIAGEFYALFYWKDEWIKSSGYQVGRDGSLVFDHVPASAVYRLVKGNVSNRERPFSFENGEQMWW